MTVSKIRAPGDDWVAAVAGEHDLAFLALAPRSTVGVDFRWLSGGLDGRSRWRSRCRGLMLELPEVARAPDA